MSATIALPAVKGALAYLQPFRDCHESNRPQKLEGLHRRPERHPLAFGCAAGFFSFMLAKFHATTCTRGAVVFAPRGGVLLCLRPSSPRIPGSPRA